MKPLARTVMGLAAACLLALTACGSAAPAAHHTAKAAATRAPATSAAPTPTSQTDPNGQQCSSLDSLGYCPGDEPSPTPTAPDTAACGTQVKAWLAEQDGTGISGNTVQHDIRAILFDAQAYVKYDPGDQGAGQNFLNIMGSEVQNLTYTATPNAPPTCADPQDLWGGDSLASGTFLGDASNASNDTSGTSEADSDVHALLNDFNSLNAQLAQTSGVKAQGCTAADQCSK